MKTDSKVMFATMKPWKLFFVVALPGMVSMFAMSIYTIIEGIFLGHRLGEAALAAVNIAYPIVLINFSLADLIGVGSSVPISIALGRKDEKSANNIFSCSVILILGLSVLMGGAMYAAAEPLARLMGAEDELIDTAVRYIRTYALCSPITTIFFALDNYLRISGYIKTSMFINIFSNVATLVMLILFLVVFKMDVVGSALAACIAMSLCSIAAMIPFVRGKALLKFQKPHFSLPMIKEIGACGSPTFMSNIAGRVTSILMNISLATLGVKYFGEGGGTMAVAAYSVLMYAGDMCQPLFYGMSDALAPTIGFNWGAKKYDRVKKIAVCNYIGAITVGAVATAFLFFGSDIVAAMFIEAEEVQLLELASHALKLFCLSNLFRWFTVSTQSLLSAIEKPVHATIMSVSVALVFPLIMLGALWGLGLDGIWLNTPGTTILAAILGVFLLISVKKSIKRLD